MPKYIEAVRGKLKLHINLLGADYFNSQEKQIKIKTEETNYCRT